MLYGMRSSNVKLWYQLVVNQRSVRNTHIFHSKKKLDKHDVETLPSSELLQELGFVKQVRSGILQWLPLGLKSLRKIENIVHTHMRDIGAVEVSLSSLSPKDVWMKTNRWSNTELFKLRDSRGADYCLSPTCEEDITTLMNNYITSYKDMPITVYQMTRKYRDEKRPRGGSLRSREFLMKDAYSFSSNKTEALKIFEEMNTAYSNIFKEIKIPYTSAWAESGDIGGDLSKEYHYKHNKGEDLLLTCDQCHESFNIERCESFPTNDNKAVKDVSVKYSLSKDNSTLIAFYYPKSRNLNIYLASKAVEKDIDMTLTKNLNNDEILKKFHEHKPEPMFARVIRVMDCRLDHTSDFPDFPLKHYSKQNFAHIDNISIVDAMENEECGACEEGILKSARSIEVGHTFHLGTKYTKALGATFSDANNKNTNFIEMGCYGIGISRLFGAIAEISKDNKGFRWPASISPYKVSFCTPVASKGENIINQKIDILKKELENSAQFNNEVLNSFNEKISLGQKIQLSQLIGIPLIVIAGPNNWPNVEIEVRGRRWSGEESWKQKYAQYKDEYGWSFLVDSNGDIEKHVVDIKNLENVLEFLIKDL
ncbi:hypothetical protein TPHA_0E01050 [Tetrapisispora phaffii CBS 4417]|uniref:proline--tRNA ligase n=1 Tax=Tetrapisispora phaffii (strain ATCC 24235 / CBS 4417 / NBRC 1672 / NRRL Y-8282 / UCD 70-5) TaxID=1071381 RepID=G8BTH1_TETPH|nr:hypothetical protein TPHA_0E01050 [Tetrapisispora phaffii CBS 4417]CCE63199.1 hypothetical protein TPHA_0E01050 [Tetrapisispora phaffii CBS 4417]